MADAGSLDAKAALVELARRGITWPAGRSTQHTGPVRAAAVLVLFGVLDGPCAAHPTAMVPADLDVLLVGRATSLSHHPGQVAFPGGRIDPGDAGPVQAAVREAVEETGLDPHGVEVLGQLAELRLAASRHSVVPVLAWWAVQSPVTMMDDAESASVFRARVADLLDPANRSTAVLAERGTVGPAFLVPQPTGQHIVWGFTAGVLDRMFDELRWTLPWDAGRTVAVQV